MKRAKDDPQHHQKPTTYASLWKLFDARRTKDGKINLDLTSKSKELARRQIFDIRRDAWGDGITFVAVCRLIDFALKRAEDRQAHDQDFDLDDELPF